MEREKALRVKSYDAADSSSWEFPAPWMNARTEIGEQMSTIVGVIGGGQLARMMIPAAVNLGLDLRVLAEGEGMSAGLAAVAVGDYRDLDTVLAFAETVDVVTFDHEHVPQVILRELVHRGIRVHPGPDALLYAQDKLLMRERLGELGLPVPDWARVHNADELAAFLADHGGHAVVKTARGGYDGKGVRVVEHAHEADDWFLALAEDANDGALLVEELVDFRRELAQVVARRPSGEMSLWPVVETVQQDGVCAEVIASVTSPPRSLSGSRRVSGSPVCSRWNCSRPPMVGCSSTSSRCGRTTAGTGRSTGRRRVSSNNTCAPYSTCPSAAPGCANRGR
jgi:formate-dependent phosphoribosylglycinamide formyltransferase (GAR transformylase)